MTLNKVKSWLRANIDEIFDEPVDYDILNEYIDKVSEKDIKPRMVDEHRYDLSSITGRIGDIIDLLSKFDKDAQLSIEYDDEAVIEHGPIKETDEDVLNRVYKCVVEDTWHEMCLPAKSIDYVHGKSDTWLVTIESGRQKEIVVDIKNAPAGKIPYIFQDTYSDAFPGYGYKIKKALDMYLNKLTDGKYCPYTKQEILDAWAKDASIIKQETAHITGFTDSYVEEYESVFGKK